MKLFDALIRIALVAMLFFGASCSMCDEDEAPAAEVPEAEEPPMFDQATPTPVPVAPSCKSMEIKKIDQGSSMDINLEDAGFSTKGTKAIKEYDILNLNGHKVRISRNKNILTIIPLPLATGKSDINIVVRDVDGLEGYCTITVPLS